MSNNSCDMPSSFWTARSISYTFSYNVTPPIMLIIGLGSHIIALIALCREARKHYPFWYQVLDTVSTATSIICLAIAIGVFRVWSGFGIQGSPWFTDNYSLMWFTAHVSFPLVNAVGLVGLYWSTVIAADRVCAMTKPLIYSSTAHRNRMRALLCASVVLGVSVSAFDMFRYYVSRDERSYVIALDDAFIASQFAKIAVNIRNLVMASGVILLIGCNVRAFIAFYRTNDHQKKGVMTDKRMVERKKTEKTLLCLTLVHGTEELVARSLQIITFAIVFAKPSFLSCGNLLMAPLIEGLFQWLLLSKVLINACVSVPFRRSLLRVLRNDNAVVTSVSPASKA